MTLLGKILHPLRRPRTNMAIMSLSTCEKLPGCPWTFCERQLELFVHSDCPIILQPTVAAESGSVSFSFNMETALAMAIDHDQVAPVYISWLQADFPRPCLKGLSK